MKITLNANELAEVNAAVEETGINRQILIATLSSVISDNLTQALGEAIAIQQEFLKNEED